MKGYFKVNSFRLLYQKIYLQKCKSWTGRRLSNASNL